MTPPPSPTGQALHELEPRPDRLGVPRLDVGLPLVHLRAEDPRRPGIRRLVRAVAVLCVCGGVYHIHMIEGYDRGDIEGCERIL